MTKVINKETKVVKELKNEVEVSMYLSTGEWVVLEEKETKKESKPFSNSSNKKSE